MLDFATARRMMVDGQIRTADVTDPRLIAALLDVPRESFLPKRHAALAYLDIDAPVGESSPRRMLKPMVMARLLQVAAIGGGDRVLDVGCATGYSSVLLGRLAGSVVALEEDAALAHEARRALAGVASVQVVEGPLTGGYPADAPFDVIVIEGAVELVPEALFRQLKEGGRLVCMLGGGAGSRGMLYRAVQGDFSGRPIFDASAALLSGFARPAAFAF